MGVQGRGPERSRRGGAEDLRGTSPGFGQARPYHLEDRRGKAGDLLQGDRPAGPGVYPGGLQEGERPDRRGCRESSGKRPGRRVLLKRSRDAFAPPGGELGISAESIALMATQMREIVSIRLQVPVVVRSG